MAKQKTLLLFLLSAIIYSNISAQLFNNQYSDDSTTYYIRFWNTSLTNLSHEWIYSNINTNINTSNPTNDVIVSDVEMENLLKTKYPALRLELSARAKEIYKNYLQNQAEARMAKAIFVKYRKIFEDSLVAHGIPKEIAFTTFALTAMQNKARGYTGAAGYWQIPYTYSRKAGLQIDSYVDERLDVLKSTSAAIKTLNDFYGIYSDWKLTLAAFTCDPSNVNKSIRRNDNIVDFYYIYPSLPYFGRDVVDAITASILFFEYDKSSYSIDYISRVDTVDISRKLHFTQICELLNLDINEIRFLNPIFKFDFVPAINHIYPLYIPKGNLAKFNILEDSIYAYKDSLLFNIKPHSIPVIAVAKPVVAEEVEEPFESSKAIYYNVKRGDNLGLISGWYEVSISQLQEWNNIKSSRSLQVGKKIKIYVPSARAKYYEKINKMSLSEKRRLAAGGSSKSTSTSKTTSSKSSHKTIYYTVKKGDTIGSIAKKYSGVSNSDIIKWNHISDPRKIQVGQKLKIQR